MDSTTIGVSAVGLVLPKLAQQLESIRTGHDEIEQNDRRRDLVRGLDRLERIDTEVKGEIVRVGEQATHCLAHELLIVDEEHHAGSRCRRGTRVGDALWRS